MTFHPKAAHWFEARVPRNQTVYALEALADHATVQLEERGHDTPPCVDALAVKRILRQFDKLCEQHAKDLPKTARRAQKILKAPEHLAATSLERLRDWAGRVNPLRRQIIQNRSQVDQLRLLSECLATMRDNSVELSALAHHTPFLYKHLFACPHDHSWDVPPCDDLYTEAYPGKYHDFVLVAANVDKQSLIESATTLFHCLPIEIPEWLPPSPEDQLREVQNRIDRFDRELDDLFEQLKRLQRDPQIADARAEVRLLRWLLAECIDQAKNPNFCRLTGWTQVSRPQALEQQLAETGIQAEVVFTPPGGRSAPPVSLSNAAWTRPFRLFVDLLGTPGEKEVDPSVPVTLIVPLLFGFMFPDLGHGLLLAGAGLLLAKRYPKALLLVPCGLAAAIFGLLFSEFFGVHGLLHAPFGHILDQPLQILIATMLLGIGLLLLGLVFSGIEAWWRSEFPRWLLEEAPVILLYLSLVSLPVWPHTWLSAVLAVTWYLGGILTLCRENRGRCIGGRLGHLLESTFQLMLATLSFMRVGAFALAHTAFSGITLQLVQQMENPVLQTLVFALAQLAIMVLEGLIVLIQTTRLIVLEFFTRFLSFGGRIYTPMTSDAGETR